MCRTAPDEAVKIDCPSMRGCFNSLSCLRIYCGHLLYFALRRHVPNALMPRKLVNAIIYKLHKHLVTEWLVNNHHTLLLPSFFSLTYSTKSSIIEGQAPSSSYSLKSLSIPLAKSTNSAQVSLETALFFRCMNSIQRSNSG